MTATTATTSHPGSQLTLARVVRSEWIKFTSLRSTYWTSGIIVLLWIGIALLLATTATFTTMGPDGQQVPITDDMRQYVTMAPVTGGVVFGMLIAGIQGVLVITGEYSTGMIRSSLAAVPGRLAVYIGKAVVLFVWMFLLGAASALGAYLVALPFLSADDLAAPLGQEELLAILGAATYLGLVALFGLGIGTLVRSGAGGIAIVLGVVLVLPTLLSLLSLWIEGVQEVTPYLLSAAGNAMMSIPGNEAMQSELAPGIASLVAAAWAAVALVAGALALKGRDA